MTADMNSFDTNGAGVRRTGLMVAFAVAASVSFSPASSRIHAAAVPTNILPVIVPDALAPSQMPLPGPSSVDLHVRAGDFLRAGHEYSLPNASAAQSGRDFQSPRFVPSAEFGGVTVFADHGLAFSKDRDAPTRFVVEAGGHQIGLRFAHRF